MLTQLAERYYRALDNDAAVWALDAYIAGIADLKRRAKAVALIRLVRSILRTRLVPTAG